MTVAARGAGDRAALMRARLGGALKRRFLLRFHVSLILLFSFCAGLVATRALLWLGVDAMWLRYLLAMLAAYAAFLAGVRLWLAYVGAAGDSAAALTRGSGRADRRGDGSAGFDLPLDLLPGPGRGGVAGGMRAPVAGGGGDFAGGGASGSFAAPDVPPDVPFDALGDAAASGSSGSGSGISLDLGDGEGLVVLVLALVVLIAIVGGAAWLVWVGPEILVEAAFEAMLAGGLLGSLRAARAGGWLGVVARRTLLPFAAVTAAACAFAVVGQAAYPEARTFRDVVRAAWLGDDAGDTGSGASDADAAIATLDDSLRRLAAGADAGAPAAREAAIGLLIRRADRLGQLQRTDEQIAAYDQAAALGRAGDAGALAAGVADALRLKGYALADGGRPDAARETYARLIERLDGAPDPELQWRLAWSMLQLALLEEHEREGAGLARMGEVVRRFARVQSAQVRVQVADAHYMQALALVWRAKAEAGGGAPAAPALASARAGFEAALAAAPDASAERAEALAGLAYTHFLAGDARRARDTLTMVAPERRAWLREAVLAQYVAHRAVAADAPFRLLYEATLKDRDG